MFRTAKKDYRMKIKRDELTATCKRTTPDQWNRFITSSKVIRIIRDKTPSELSEKLSGTYFEEKRQPGVGFFYDNSKLKIGRQSIQNRLLFMRSITYPWNLKPMTNDLIRIEMKKSFPFVLHEIQNNLTS